MSSRQKRSLAQYECCKLTSSNCLHVLFFLFTKVTGLHSFSTKQDRYDGHLTPLPISKDLYGKVALLARVPAMFLDILTSNAAIQVYATPQLPPIQSFMTAPDLRKEYLCK